MKKYKVKKEYAGRVRLENATGSLVLEVDTPHEELTKFVGPHHLEYVDIIQEAAPAPVITK